MTRRRPEPRRAGGLLLALALVAARPAAAMTIETVPVRGSEASALLLQGRIVADDPARLAKALRRGDFTALLLNSPGGSVLAARDMARLVHNLRVPVVVPSRAVCASACFLLYAAARDKVAEPGAMIGVHSASVSGGNETMDTLGVTTLMAREAALYGVPPVVTGRMVTTAPGQMAWLSRQELEAMGARIGSSRAQTAGRVSPGSEAGDTSDWTRGFEQGQAGDGCAVPRGIGNAADFALGCRSGQRSATARVTSRPDAPSDWTRGFEYGRSGGAAVVCEAPASGVVNARDWSLGCASGRRAAGG